MKSRKDKIEKMVEVIFCPNHTYWPYCEYCRTHDTTKPDAPIPNKPTKEMLLQESYLQRELLNS